ncbi:MAG TPA: DedA family protein [Rickettsiales bacterium]|nr:DedA family protein [Rickettsiales bacterium]
MSLHAIFETIINSLIIFINEIGYFGIFIGMFLESTVFPLPSEVIMIPAGMAAGEGLMNIYIVLLAGILGNVFGAIFSYYIAMWLGRAILFRVGKYFFLKPVTIIKMENFFNKHGEISVFIGRLIPGFRHFISLPAGVAKMNFTKFTFYTSLGSTIWTTILTILGFFIGKNQDLIAQYLPMIVGIAVAFCVVLIGVYIFFIPARK